VYIKEKGVHIEKLDGLKKNGGAH